MIFLVGIIVGCILGLTGSGGSVFAVPLLIGLAGLEPTQAIGVSLGAVSATAAIGVLMQLRRGTIQWLPALVYAGIGSLFAPVGNWVGQQFNPQALLAGFSILLVLVAYRLWRQVALQPEYVKIVRAAPELPPTAREAICRGNDNGPFRLGWRCIAIMSSSAIATGLLAGLFGVGGGFLIVPALLAITAITMHQAVATSLVVIALVSFSGFASFMVSGAAVSFNILAATAAGGALGMFASKYAGQRITGIALQKTFAALMLLAALFILYKAITTG